jgi:hypothetical protein
MLFDYRKETVMLRIFAGLYGTAMLLRAIPVLVVGLWGLALLGTPIAFLDRGLGMYFASDNPAMMVLDPVEVKWQTGTSKALTMKIENKSGDAWGRFHFRCNSDIGSLDFTDMSGLLPGQAETRTYQITERSSTLGRVWDCQLRDHMRGKPTEFDTYADRERVGGGGWGNRIPEGYRDDIVMPDASMPMMEDAGASVGTGGDYIPADGVMD